MPIYPMLWAGQLHVVLVLAVTLILVGLMRLERDDRKSTRYLRWIQAGILISVIVEAGRALLMLPVLLITRPDAQVGPAAGGPLRRRFHPLLDRARVESRRLQRHALGQYAGRVLVALSDQLGDVSESGRFH